MSAVVAVLQSAARKLLADIHNASAAEAEARRQAERALDQKCTAMNRLAQINDHLVSLGETPVEDEPSPGLNSSTAVYGGLR